MKYILKIKNKHQPLKELESVEELKAYTYCSIILDDDSQKRLFVETKKFREALPTLKDAVEEKQVKLCHHITINMGKTLKVEGYTQGQEVTFDILKFAAYVDPAGLGIAAVSVSPNIKTESGSPHITIFINGMSAGKAKELKFDSTGKLEPTMLEKFHLKDLKGYINIPSEVL